MTTEMDKDLAAMLARATASGEYSKPMPLIDKALAIVNDESLSYSDKVSQIEELEAEAKAQDSVHELTAFGEVWESLHIVTPLDAISDRPSKDKQ